MYIIFTKIKHSVEQLKVIYVFNNILNMHTSKDLTSIIVYMNDN